MFRLLSSNPKVDLKIFTIGVIFAVAPVQDAPAQPAAAPQDWEVELGPGVAEELRWPRELGFESYRVVTDEVARVVRDGVTFHLFSDEAGGGMELDQLSVEVRPELDPSTVEDGRALVMGDRSVADPDAPPPAVLSDFAARLEEAGVGDYEMLDAYVLEVPFGEGSEVVNVIIGLGGRPER